MPKVKCGTVLSCMGNLFEFYFSSIVVARDGEQSSLSDLELEFEDEKRLRN